MSGYCDQHDIVVSDGLVCPACARQQLRDQVNMLEARISDLAAENLDLRRRVSEIEHLLRGSRLVQP